MVLFLQLDITLNFKTMKIISFLFLSIILFSSCRPKSIDIDVNSATPKLVAFTHIIPDNIMIVALTKSFSMLEGNTVDSIQNLLVSGASVQLKFNNQVFDFYELSPGIYASYSSAFQTNGEYEFTATFGNETITSTTTMLPKVAFTSVIPTIEKTKTDTTTYITINFTDNNATENWYLLNFYKKQPTSVGADIVNYFNNGNNTLAKTLLVSDKEFDHIYQNKIKLPELYHKDSIVVTLSNINEGYFNYLGYRIGHGNIFTELNLEPLNYPTNIKNGYGFFNTHFPDVKYFDLGDY